MGGKSSPTSQYYSCAQSSTKGTKSQEYLSAIEYDLQEDKGHDFVAIKVAVSH